MVDLIRLTEHYCLLEQVLCHDVAVIVCQYLFVEKHEDDYYGLVSDRGKEGTWKSFQCHNAEQNYRDGKPHGHWREFDLNSKLSFDATFCHGKREGLVCYGYGDGNFSQVYYVNGEAHNPNGLARNLCCTLAIFSVIGIVMIGILQHKAPPIWEILIITLLALIVPFSIGAWAALFGIQPYSNPCNVITDRSIGCCIVIILFPIMGPFLLGKIVGQRCSFLRREKRNLEIPLYLP